MAKKFHGPSPIALARAAADEYLNALAGDLPFDAPPGDVNLVEHFTKIQNALLKQGGITEDHPDIDSQNEDAAMRAGYLLGVQIGLRLSGGTR